MSKVWIVSRGERGEGSSVVCVCLSEVSAIAEARKEMSRFNFDGQDKWEMKWDNIWYSGCDYVRVQSFDIVS